MEQAELSYSNFTHFVGIDWTGAKGRAHAGLAIALCAVGEGAPKLISPPSGKRRWSREECAAWISAGMGLGEGARALVGLDSSFGMPFADEETYLPGAPLPADVRGLWAHVDTLCAGDADLYGGGFVDAHAEHYLRGDIKGARYSRRMRVAERLAVDSGAGPCESVFHLVGPSQVGLSGLSTMRMLHRLNQVPHVALWPFDEDLEKPVVVVEIYAAAFAALAGHKGKFRRREDLKSALLRLGATGPLRVGGDMSDHAADAVITAAALRNIHDVRKYWNPAGLSTMVRRTEGWVFGVE
ncbi:hypothetical protein [Kordiimonas marina]|uniref:hypothetical protein n=1 Tax=Kordiimonas marina TaxID=2872312 RepID=UPI001FF1A2F7|nr:hypothetical protein [Kordiimonas marina]MCJ9429268.1 hypothetical protein [Kordiimonas marina]